MHKAKRYKGTVEVLKGRDFIKKYACSIVHPTWSNKTCTIKHGTTRLKYILFHVSGMAVNGILYSSCMRKSQYIGPCKN